MFVLDRAKVRTIALVMVCTAAIQLWPNAYAVERRATLTKDVEIKAPQKTKKRKTGHTNGVTQASPWRLAPVAARGQLAIPTKAEKKDALLKLVMKTAYKQLGKPYRYGAVGPNNFDCSGFTAYVWRKAGVHLPHNSGAQRGATKAVPLDKMKPGDLIFSSGHVGMYVGNGKMIHSPRSGRTVSVDAVHSRAYGAGRPLP